MRTSTFSALHWGLLVAVGLAGAGGEHARAATLRWKFNRGETLHYQLEEKTVSATTNQGKTIKTTVTQTIDMSWAVKDVGADGTATVTMTFDRMRTKINTAFGSFEYDTKQNDAPEGIGAATVVTILKKLIGAPFTARMSPLGELSDIQVPESVVKMLKEAGAGRQGAPTGMFSEGGLKNMIIEAGLPLPKDDVAQGTTWKRQSKVQAPAAGTMIVDKVYTYDGPAGAGEEKIGLKSQVSLEPMANSPVTFKIESQDGRGTYVFDNKAGRMSQSSVNVKLKLHITGKIKTGPQESDVQELNAVQDQDTSTIMKLQPSGSSTN